MKKCVILLLLSCFFILINAQENKSESETAKPTLGVKLDRPVSFAKIENEVYYDVIVELDAADIDAFFNTGVKITIKDKVTKKKIYKKRFYNSYLYAFSNGTIQVGKGNALVQVVLQKNNDEWLLEVREKGLY